MALRGGEFTSRCRRMLRWVPDFAPIFNFCSTSAAVCFGISRRSTGLQRKRCFFFAKRGGELLRRSIRLQRKRCPPSPTLEPARKSPSRCRPVLRCEHSAPRFAPVCRPSHASDSGLQTVALKRFWIADLHTQAILDCRPSHSSDSGLQT